MTETWKQVPGYESLYEVSNAGRMKTLSRRMMCKARGGKLRLHRVPEFITTG